jgi:hypothetical protein
MDKALRVFNISLAIVLSMAFIISGLLALTAYNLERKIFDPEVYIGILDGKQIYDRLPSIVTEALMDASRSDYGAIAVLKELPKAELESILRLIIPQDLLKSMTDDIIFQTIGYFNGESENISLTLVELKEYLLSPTGVDAIYQYISAQPDCTLEHLTSMVTGESGIILCKPPEQFLGFDLRPIYEAQIRSGVRLIPEEVSLIEAEQETNQVIRDLSRLRMVSRLSPFIPLLMLLFITLLVVRSLKDLLTWWGVPLAVTGISGIFLSLGSSFMFNYFFQNYIAPRFLKDLPISFLEVIQEVTRAISAQVVSPMLIQALILSGIGVVMVTSAILIPLIKKETT